MGSMGSMGSAGVPGATGAMGIGNPDEGGWNLMFVDALIKTRGAIVSFPGPMAELDPPWRELDDPRPLIQWSPSVRQHVALFELISSLHFQVGGATASLYHVELNKARFTYKTAAVASLLRPNKEVFRKQAARVAREGRGRVLPLEDDVH